MKNAVGTRPKIMNVAVIFFFFATFVTLGMNRIYLVPSALERKQNHTSRKFW